MTNKIVRWGILSTANINRHLIPPLHASPRSELRAVASRNLDKATAYAEQWNIPQAYGSYEALLADPEIDAVYISLPNTLHAKWAIAAANAGKHVLCEKPLVLTLEEFDRVAAAAKANRTVLFEAFANLHHPQHRQVQALIDDGRIGELRHIDGMYYYFMTPQRAVNDIRLHADLGGGSMWDIGVYCNALTVLYAGGRAPERVWATRTLGAEVDIAFAGQMRFASGVTAQIRCGFQNPLQEQLRLSGSEGVIELSHPHNTDDKTKTTITITANSGEREVLEIAAKDSYSAEIETMEACVLDGADPILPLSLSREFLRSVLALQESAEIGALVTL